MDEGKIANTVTQERPSRRARGSCDLGMEIGTMGAWIPLRVTGLGLENGVLVNTHSQYSNGLCIAW